MVPDGRRIIKIIRRANFTNLHKNIDTTVDKHCHISKDHKHYYQILHRYGTRQDLLDDILDSNEELFEAWEIYQDFLQIMKNPNYDHNQKYKKLIEWSLKNQSNKNQLYKTAASTIYHWRDAIFESFKPYKGMTLSNGFIEGKNNRIKHLKRTGYGYRSFVHFKKRILLIDSLSY